jgi:hypothetical protein
MRPAKDQGASAQVTLALTDVPLADVRAGLTELGELAAASEHAVDRVSGSDKVRVTERHGIWTVTKAGNFVGDYHDPEAAIAAAAQSRRRGNAGGVVGGAADPWQRSEEKSGR